MTGLSAGPGRADSHLRAGVDAAGSAGLPGVVMTLAGLRMMAGSVNGAYAR
jgi:hypothetical protein